MTKLKPCPFCGQEFTVEIAIIHPGVPLLYPNAYRVVCQNYRGGCGAAAGPRESKEAAAAAWNSRVTAAAEGKKCE